MWILATFQDWSLRAGLELEEILKTLKGEKFNLLSTTLWLAGKRTERRVHPKCLSSLQVTKPQQCPWNLQRKKPSELDIEIPPKGNGRVRAKFLIL